MRKIEIRPQRGKFIVHVIADGHTRQYEYSNLADAQARAKRISEFLDIKESSISIVELKEQRRCEEWKKKSR